MTNSASLHPTYVHLYKQLRNYIWDIDTVMALAELETELYTTFPDVSSIQRNFDLIDRAAREVASEDEDLADALEKFHEAIDHVVIDYAKLPSVLLIEEDNIS